MIFKLKAKNRTTKHRNVYEALKLKRALDKLEIDSILIMG